MRDVRICRGDKTCAAAGEAGSIIEVCRQLHADAMAIEAIDHSVVVTADISDGAYAVAICDPAAHLPSVARGLQALLDRQANSGQAVAILPASTAQSALRRWERQIAAAFGEGYAARLVSGAAGPAAAGRTTLQGLEEVRRRLSSAIGGCIDLQKVDK